MTLQAIILVAVLFVSGECLEGIFYGGLRVSWEYLKGSKGWAGHKRTGQVETGQVGIG